MESTQSSNRHDAIDTVATLSMMTRNGDQTINTLNPGWWMITMFDLYFDAQVLARSLVLCIKRDSVVVDHHHSWFDTVQNVIHFSGSLTWTYCLQPSQCGYVLSTVFMRKPTHPTTTNHPHPPFYSPPSTLSVFVSNHFSINSYSCCNWCGTL